MWKKVSKRWNKKNEDRANPEDAVQDDNKQDVKKVFKESGKETWNYHMTNLPLKEEQENQISQENPLRKKEPFLGESVQ